MVSGTTVIKNPSGLHLRPAGILCKEALLYKSKISNQHPPGNSGLRHMGTAHALFI